MIELLFAVAVGAVAAAAGIYCGYALRQREVDYAHAAADISTAAQERGARLAAELINGPAERGDEMLQFLTPSGLKSAAAVAAAADHAADAAAERELDAVAAEEDLLGRAARVDGLADTP